MRPYRKYDIQRPLTEPALLGVGGAKTVGRTQASRHGNKLTGKARPKT